MIGVAVGWQMYALTHSTFALGMVGLVQFLPLLLLMLLVGYVADRVSRKSILALCQAVESLTAVALGIATLLHHLRPAGIFCGVALLGAARAFENLPRRLWSPRWSTKTFFRRPSHGLPRQTKRLPSWDPGSAGCYISRALTSHT
jgi:MFS family permease